MQIFILDRDPRIAAVLQVNKSLVKMVLETGQLLCCAITSKLGPDSPDWCYKQTHLNHPCAIWARKSYENFMWLQQHGIALAFEYSNRFGGKVHKTERIITLSEQFADLFPKIGLTEFAQAIPDEFKSDDVVEAYCNFYASKPYVPDTWSINSPDFTYAI